jgi:hypothetical protein
VIARISCSGEASGLPTNGTRVVLLGPLRNAAFTKLVSALQAQRSIGVGCIRCRRPRTVVLLDVGVTLGGERLQTNSTGCGVVTEGPRVSRHSVPHRLNFSQPGDAVVVVPLLHKQTNHPYVRTYGRTHMHACIPVHTYVSTYRHACKRTPLTCRWARQPINMRTHTMKMTKKTACIEGSQGLCSGDALNATIVSERSPCVRTSETDATATPTAPAISPLRSSGRIAVMMNSIKLSVMVSFVPAPVEKYMLRSLIDRTSTRPS